MIINTFRDALKYSEANSRLKIAIVRSNYHLELTRSLENGCRKSLEEAGVLSKNIITFEVPGSWEISLMVKKVAESKKFDAVAAFGVIIKGATYHFELIANEVAKSLMQISLSQSLPIAFEVLSTYNLKQAKERSVGKYNKGLEASAALLEMISNLKKI